MLSLLFIFLCHVFLSQASILHCDFETDCVDFTFDSNWGLTDGEHSQGIDHDHTLNTSAGHYRYYDPQLQSAQIKTSDSLESSTDHTLCFYMWYYTSLISFPFSIQVGQGDEDQLARVLFSTANQNLSTTDWTLINVTLPNEKLYIFIRLNVTTKPLAFDDFSVDYCDGPRPVPPKVSYSCDFESSCTDDFVSLPEYPYQWFILNASDAVKIESGAPTVDYTFGNESGHYALLPNSKIFQPGNVGYLHLQKEIQVASEESYCLNFQYYGFGHTFANNHLKIYSWASDETKTVQMLWPAKNPNKYPYTFNKWTWIAIALPLGNYSLLFYLDGTDYAIRTFALDNIDITSCNYPPSSLGPPNSLLSFSCNFDNSTMCDMVNRGTISTPTFNFTVFTGNTVPNKDLGPARDHTSNSTLGGFLYWNRHLPFTPRDSGRVYTSKTIEQNTGTCVKFAYYVNSTIVNKNGTTIIIYMGEFYSTTLWSLLLDDSQGWQTVIIPVSGPAGAKTIYFDVSQTESVPVSVAFDDIEIDQCGFIIPTTTTVTTSTSTTTSTTQILTSSGSTTTATTTTSSIASTSIPILTTSSSAHQLLSLSGYSFITVYFLTVIFRKYLF